MRRNPIQFAVVREDPGVERLVLESLGRPPRRVLLVASGGCSALSLRAWFPDVEFTLVDPNPAQLELVRRKVDVLRSEEPATVVRERFGLGADALDDLSQCGNFESLFAGLRHFVEQFVAAPAEIEAWFDVGDEAARAATLREVFADPYWQAAFAMWFSEPLLVAMFTEAATQHAQAGSYPGYFRSRIEEGLLAADAPTNRFLHHVFLGRYLEREGAVPPFLALAPPTDPPNFVYRETALQDVESFAGFDLVGLSNVMDWMDVEAARALAARVGGALDPGACVLWRQLNNPLDRRPWLGTGCGFDDAFDGLLTACDRSLFYETIRCGRARP